ncbi:MAG: AraC family transcriptional regulator [Candidatus Krumholzibacteriia bacterium]
MDALADILNTVHLSGSLYCRSELTAPWGMAVPRGETAQFHVVRRGRCWLVLDDDAHPREPLRLEAGDMVVLPTGSAHRMVDDPATPTIPLDQLIATLLPTATATGPAGPLVFGGRGEPTTLICGYFRFAAGAAHPLLSVLPAVVYLRGEGGRARSWLESTLDVIAAEATAGRPGGEALVNKLTEALFIQVIRAYLEEQDGADPSWLAGLRDPQIAAALGMIHRDPAGPWTVELLAARVGMSRSSFSARFRELVGEPPLHYLTRWRMQVAADHIRADRLSLAEIAGAVGYAAEASFSKVFKRFLGVAPGAYRRQAESAR